MKKLALLTLLAMLPSLSGCRSISATAPNGAKVSINSLGNTTSWGLLTYDASTGTWRVENFNNDQAASYQATLSFANAVVGALAAQKPTNNVPVKP